jgi:hypothetical protein
MRNMVPTFKGCLFPVSLCILYSNEKNQIKNELMQNVSINLLKNK